MTQDPETPGTELPANAEETEPTDLAAEPSTDVPNAEEAPPAAAEDTPAPAEEAPAEAASPPAASDAPTGDAPAGEAPAEAAPADDLPVEETPVAEGDTAEAAPPEATERKQPPPGAGPVIIGTAPEPPPLPTKIQRAAPDKPQRPRRRRVNATQRHRNIFFARLNDFRRSQAAGIEAPEELDAEATEAAVAAAEAPAEDALTDVAAPAEEAAPESAAAEEAPAEVAASADADPAASPDVATSADVAASAEDASPEGGEGRGEEASARDKRRSSPPPPIDRPRLIAAIERAGGEEVLREALAPKRDENGQPLKWATVCADACKGLKPGDPVFGAWVRLAATPVSAIKNEIGMPRDDRRGGRGGPRRGGPGGDRRPRRDDRPGGRGDRVSREDLAKLATDGRVGANIRIIGLDDDDKKAREKRRKEEREAKREAERQRLSRLGY